jgi:hypothetical protein
VPQSWIFIEIQGLSNSKNFILLDTWAMKMVSTKLSEKNNPSALEQAK